MMGSSSSSSRIQVNPSLSERLGLESDGLVFLSSSSSTFIVANESFAFVVKNVFGLGRVFTHLNSEFLVVLIKKRHSR